MCKVICQCFLIYSNSEIKKTICWTLHDVYLRPSRTGLLGKLEIWYVRACVQPSLLRSSADAIIVHDSLLKDQLCSKKVNSSKVYVISHSDYRYLVQDERSTTPKDNSALKDYIVVFVRIVPYKEIEVLINVVRVGAIITSGK
jgi:hypothetical protein